MSRRAGRCWAHLPAEGAVLSTTADATAGARRERRPAGWQVDLGSLRGPKRRRDGRQDTGGPARALEGTPGPPGSLPESGRRAREALPLSPARPAVRPPASFRAPGPRGGLRSGAVGVAPPSRRRPPAAAPEARSAGRSWLLPPSGRCLPHQPLGSARALEVPPRARRPWPHQV